MAKYECKCGKLISTNADESPVLRVYTEFEWEEKVLQYDYIETIKIPFPDKEVWKCPNCKRIYVFNKNNVEKVYVLETY